MSEIGESSNTQKWVDEDTNLVEQQSGEVSVEADPYGSVGSGGSDEDEAWEAVSNEPSSDSIGDSEDEVEINRILREKSGKDILFGDVTELEGEICLCKLIKTKVNALSLMEILVDTTPSFDSVNCFIDNIIRAYNLIFGDNKSPSGSKKVAFADLFYRIRHEVLFKCLCMSFSLPVGHSDKPFSDYGIESKRTPDLIIEEDGFLKIVEVTAVSSIEKAAQNKGMEEMGFESKYKRELAMLLDQGRPSVYIPVFFDMSNTNNPVNFEQIITMKRHFSGFNEMFYNLLTDMSKKLAILTQNMKNSLILPSAILFSNVTPITAKHPNLEYLYKKTRLEQSRNHYEELTVSSYVYGKIINDKGRFYWMLDNNRYTDSQLLGFIINTLNHRITLEQNSNGATINDLRQFLINNDIVNLLKYTVVKMGNVIVSSTQSETGVKFYERTSRGLKGVIAKNIPLLVSHTESDYKFKEFSIIKYKRVIELYKQDNYTSIHYDPNYEEMIIKSITEFDSTRDEAYSVPEFPNLLGNMKSRDIDIDEVMRDISYGYLNKNTFTKETMPLQVPKMKQPFLLPIANLSEGSYCSLEYKNETFIYKIIQALEERNPFTSTLLKNVLDSKYKMYGKSKLASSTLNSLIQQRYEISNKLNILQKKLSKDSLQPNKKVSKVDSPEYRGDYQALRDSYRQVSKEVNQRKKTEGVGSDISYVRLPCKGKNSHFRSLYEQEMRHFKDRKKQSTIEGVGIINDIETDYNSDFLVFQEISSLLCEDRGANPDKVLDKYVSQDACLLYDLKCAAIEKYSNLIEQVRRSYLGHSAALISRMAHSLMFYSQLPFSSEYFRVDNLGYKNVLLIVRGGKKIFKSKSSKLFRLLYPISEELLPWYTLGHKNQGSFSLINIEGEHYGLTPWSFLHESILTDSISFYSRVSSFTFLNLNPSIDLKMQFGRVSMNVLLAFHNRRQTEVILANMRYILLSTLGDFTGVEQILPEFFDFNYDRFQSFIRNSIMVNYPRYFKQFQSLKDSKGPSKKEINISDFVDSRLRNIFTLDVVGKIEDLALMIYSTFLMTKAPYQKIVERSKNLSGILDIHEQFDREVGLSLDPKSQTEKITVTLGEEGLTGYVNELMSSDFNFDPKFCALIGNFVDSIFLNNNEVEDIEVNWIRIMNQPWDEMATSTGLRGDYDLVEDFWGQKGYFVVYKTLLNEPGFSDKLIKIFLSDIDDDTKRKIIRDMNELYKDKFLPDREFLIFHAVDKVQWRGGREIYVMDLLTKTMQQPIEKFMAVLCKKLDNELISIPSDRRAQVIHHAIFEKDLPLKDMMTWYLTLDCSKWAPKSVFIKFVVMILNMSCVPNTFKTHFMNYIEKLYSKRIYFNNSEVETLSKNIKYKDACSRFLLKDDKVGGYYLEMPYSWVMGIFNYTSSFLHAANQKYLSHILMRTSLISYKEETSLVMFAHSDDSGGRLSVSDVNLAKRGLILYEIFLRSCNHLLSKKKSVVSRIYFEILSVIYIFGKLLALLPKFLGGIRFLPTDKGPAQDMLQSYSKSIEVMIAGADFSISYIVMKVYSYMVWRFYYHKDPSELDYERPVQYLGLPDAHPLFVLLCGSDADILRLIRNGVDLPKLITFVNTMSAQMDGEGPIKPLKFEIKVKGVKRGFEEFIEAFRGNLGSWSIRNVNYHNSGLNSLSFLRKLNDSGFVGSLVNESTVRRISRCYFMRTGDSAITRFRNVKLSLIMDSIVLCQSYKTRSPIDNILKDILSSSDIESIESEFDINRPMSERVMLLLKETLKSPLRIYKYLNMMGLKDRKINETFRTLKPTHVQLVKSAKVFSSDFDPASLVSYIKEPEMRWALPSVKGLFTAEAEVKNFVEKVGFNCEDIDPDMLLRICRTYGRENTKNIYLYSRVPGEIRQIKTYSAFLTFLSVNSFSNMEISGLTLKMSNKEMGKEYVQPHLIEEIYLVNNVISIILTILDKCGLSFLEKMSLNPIDEIEWIGGDIKALIEHLNSMIDLDVRYSLLNAQLSYLMIKLGKKGTSAEFLNGSSYYTFLKSQKVRKGWYGKGEIYIKVDSNFYSFEIENSEPVMLYSNRVGKLPQHHTEFIMDVFENVDITFKNVKRPKSKNFNINHFGYDSSSDFSILPGREIEYGVQCINLSSRNEFVDQLYSFEVQDLRGDTIIIKKGFCDEYVYKKIQLLPIKKSEILMTMKTILNPRDFEDKMLEFGVTDFEEFIYTEVLTEYGSNLYTDFNELIDNFAASKLFTIFRETYKNNISKIPNVVNFSPLPASEGSLVRILIDYSRHTGDNVMKVPLNLDPVIMQLRSEYPESVSTIVGEKLGEHHLQIYSGKEIKEINDCYDSLLNDQSIDNKRVNLVKLMTYWGYGSLVHNIKSFSLNRVPENYLYFNSKNLGGSSKALYSEVFEFLNKELNELISKYRPMYSSLEYPVQPLSKIMDFDTVVSNYNYHIAMCTFNYVSMYIRSSLYNMQYINLLLACFKEEDFLAELHHRMSKNYILGSLPINYNNRFEFVATINTLKTIWCSSNKQKLKLDYNVKLQRYPKDSTNITTLVKKLGWQLKGTDTYYNGFFTDVLYSYVHSLKNIHTKKCEYRIDTKISKLSDAEVNMNLDFYHPRPIKSDVLENDAWEDYNYEISMPEPDEDEIEILQGDLGDDIYKPTVTRRLNLKGKNVTVTAVNWIVMPNITSTEDIHYYVRQVGENVVIATDTYIDSILNRFKGSGCRLVNLSKVTKDKCKPMFLFYTFKKQLSEDTEFLSKYLGGQEYRYNVVDHGLLKDNYIRNSEGRVCEPKNQGVSNLLEVIVGEKVIVDTEEGVKFKPSIGEECVETSEADKTQQEIEDDKTLGKIEKINMAIEDVRKDNNLSEEAIKSLKDKYLEKSVKHGLPISVILRSIMNESDLISLNSDILNNKSNISTSDQVKMFLSPGYFGLGRSLNKNELNPIKDKKLRSELNSLHSDLASAIGSNTLKLSKKFSSIVKANIKFWILSANSAKVKADNKKFLITLITTICNNVILGDEETDDTLWQIMLNKASLYISDDGDDVDDEELFNLLFNIVPASRIKYKLEGS